MKEGREREKNVVGVEFLSCRSLQITHHSNNNYYLFLKIKINTIVKRVIDEGRMKKKKKTRLI